PRAPRRGQIVEQRHALSPADATVGHALPVDQRLPRNEILASGLQMRLDHQTEDVFVSRAELARYLGCDLDLAHRILVAVRVAAIDHEPLRETCLCERL